MNRFSIPDLTPLWEEVRDFVMSHQGGRGFIDTRDESCDTIWCFYYDEGERCAIEVQLLGIRVRGGDVEVLPDFRDLDILRDAEDLSGSEMWHSLKDSDIVYFIPTLFGVAECVEEYVEHP